MDKRIASMQRKMDRAQLVEIRNVKAVAIKEAIDFVKASNEKLMKMFTHEQHRLVYQFLEFKKRSSKGYDEIEELKNRVKEIELPQASVNFANEAEYALQKKNPMKLYDCLLPKFPEYLTRARSVSSNDSNHEDYIHKDKHRVSNDLTYNFFLLESTGAERRNHPDAVGTTRASN